MMFLPTGGNAHDPDYESWLAAVAGNSGTVSTTAKAAVREANFLKKTAGLWTKCARINYMVGDFPACQVPMKVGTGANAVEANTGFAAGNWTESTGLQCAVGRHWDTGLTPANAGMSSGNGHVAIYVTTGNNGTYIGSAGTSALTSVSYSFGNHTGAISNDTVAVNGIPNGLGHLMANANGGNLNQHRMGCGMQVQDSTTSGAIGTSSFGVGALNTAGTFGSEPANGRFMGYHVGVALSKRECRTMGRIWQVFQTRMGRAVVDAGGSPIVVWGDSLTTTRLHLGIKAAATTRMVIDRGVTGQTATQIATRALVGDDVIDDVVNVFLLGKNDFNNIAGANAINTGVQDTVIQQIASCVSNLTGKAPKNNRYLVLATLNARTVVGDYNTGNNYQNYMAVFNNRTDALSKTYAASNYADGISRYRDTRTYIVSLYNPGNPTDVTDNGLDTPPSSIMSDTIHWASGGYNPEGAAIVALFATNGW